MPAPTFDQAKASSFGERMMGMLNEAALSLMVSLGHRTGLLDNMAEMPPATSEEIARASGLNERYVREWLGAMVTGRIVEYDAAAGKYRLPVEHAASLTRSAGPDNIAVTLQWIAVLGGVEDEIAEAFSHGEGVPYSAYRRFHDVMAEESAMTVVAGLHDHIIPLVPGLKEKLEQGLRVLDVGCGSGRAMIHLAESFPESHFSGYDFSQEAIETAREEAQQRGLSNTRFDTTDAAQMHEPQAYDLITAFDAIHDQARPADVLQNIHAAVKPGGVFLMQDIKASSHVHENVEHPIAPFIYTISCMHCMSVSLSNQGPGLGAAWGKQKALEMLDEAGFKNVDVHELDHDIINYWYVARREG